MAAVTICNNFSRPYQKKPLNVSPFEAMYGRPTVPLGLPHSHDGPKLPSHLPFPLLAQIQDALWQHMDNLLPRPHPNLLYPFLQIGDKVYMTVQSHSDLIPKWQGPYTVILLTPTTAKLKEITPWVHITRLRKVMQPNDENAYQTKTTQALQLQNSHGFHWPQPTTDEPVGFTAAITSGTTPDRYLGLESSRIHIQTCWRLHLHPVAAGDLL